MIQQALELPAFESMPLMRKDEFFTAAYCYISFYSHKEKKLKYITLNIDASYTDSIDQWYSSRNPIALKYITLSKTGEAPSSMSKAFKLGSYTLTAVRIQHQRAGKVELDPRDVQANLYSVAFQHSWLGSLGTPEDTTIAYMITRHGGLEKFLPLALMAPEST